MTKSKPRVEYNGVTWELDPPTKTSDGFLLANGHAIDPDTDEPAVDEDGWPIFHSFFLGRAPEPVDGT